MQKIAYRPLKQRVFGRSGGGVLKYGTSTISIKTSKGVKIKKVTYKSKNKKIATVSKKGKVTAKKKGSTQIIATVKYTYKKKTYTKKLTYKVKVTTKKVTVTPTPAPTPTPVVPDKPAETPVTPQPTTEAHNHVYTTKSDATNHWQECACGDKKDVAAHTFDNGTITTAPTRKADGVKTFKCTVCGYEKTEKVAWRNAADEAALKALIAEQKKWGATVSENIDSEEYTWNDNGRLVGINWQNKSLDGAISFAGLDALESIVLWTGSTASEDYCEEMLNTISKIDISKNAELKVLNVGGIGIKTLDLSNAQKLEELDCSGNELTELNIKSLNNLRELDCSDNKMKSLHIGENENKALVKITANNIASSDADPVEIRLIGCADLKYLQCCSNAFGSKVLFVDSLKNLEELDVTYCNLTSLNLAANTELIELSAGGNKLESLNLTTCNKLENLSCSNNELKSITWPTESKLKRVDICQNKLSSLDVSGYTYLERLSCNNNELTSLKVDGCSNLEWLWCSNNELTSISVSTCKKLYYLDCSSLKLNALNVMENTNLWNLNCSKNALLDSLNVSNNSALEYLYCGGCAFTTLDVGSLSELGLIEVRDNKLSELDVRSNTKLGCVYCDEDFITKVKSNGGITFNPENWD